MGAASYEATTDGDAIRQGDVLRFLPLAGREDRAALAIVVTADCDLEHNKYQGYLSVVPAYDAHEFLYQFRFDTLANEWAKKIAGSVVTVLGARYGVSGISESGLLDWLADSELNINVIAQRLTAEVNPDVSSSISSWLPAALTQVHSLLTPRRAQISDLCGILASARRFHPDADKPKAASEAMSDKAWSEVTDLIDPKRKLSADYFVAIDPGPKLDGIYYANLRRIEMLNPDQIQLDTTEANESTVAARVARLLPVFRYALTQRMANLFSRIGIPSDVESTITRRISELRGQQ